MLFPSPPLSPAAITVAHGGALTGHWEFDLAIALVFFAIISYSFLLPADAPRGLGRAVIYGITLVCFLAALALAVLGFRSVALGQ